MPEHRRPHLAVWGTLLLVLGALGFLLVPDALQRHQLYQSIEAALPDWQRAVADHARCVDAQRGPRGVTAEGLLWTRLREGALPDRLRTCGETHLPVPERLSGLETADIDDPLARAVERLNRTFSARRRDHGPALPGVDDRSIRGTCDRMQTLASALAALETILGVPVTAAANPCELVLPGLSGVRPPSASAGDQLLDIQLHGDHVVTQLRPSTGGTRFAMARLSEPSETGQPAKLTWTVTTPMPALADGRDYAWDPERGLWTVGFETPAKRWRGYHWLGEWRPSAWLPTPYTPDRMDWTAEGDRVVVLARSGPVSTGVFRFESGRIHGPVTHRQVERFDPMTHIGGDGSVTTVDLEFPAAGPHLSVTHRPGGDGELTQAFLPLTDARTQWFVQPHVVGCSHERRHWAVVGSRWLVPTEDGGDGRWWIFTSADDGATWREVAKTPKEWQLFSPVLACRGDALVNVTVSRREGEAGTHFLHCTPDTCAEPQRLAAPPARHISLRWRDEGLSVLLAFRAHAARFQLSGAPLAAEPKGAFRRLPVRSAWDTIAYVGAQWFDLVTVDPLPW